VRVNEELRAQLDIVAQLTDRSMTEEIRLALEHWIVENQIRPGDPREDCGGSGQILSATRRPGVMLLPLSLARMTPPRTN
jgi:hypothetical protein